MTQFFLKKLMPIEFPGKNIKHEIHVFHRPIPAELEFHGREEAVVSFNNSVVRLRIQSRKFIQVPFHQLHRPGNRFDQFPDHFSDRTRRGATVSEQLPGFLGSFVGRSLEAPASSRRPSSSRTALGPPNTISGIYSPSSLPGS